MVHTLQIKYVINLTEIEYINGSLENSDNFSNDSYGIINHLITDEINNYRIPNKIEII